jgi:hypothetical protein
MAVYPFNSQESSVITMAPHPMMCFSAHMVPPHHYLFLIPATHVTQSRPRGCDGSHEIGD